MSRPVPPASLLESLFLTLEPAPELWEWIFREILSKEGSIHNEDHAHLIDADIQVMWASSSYGKQGRTVLGQAEQVMFRAGGWQKARMEQQMRYWFGGIPDFIITLAADYCATCSDADFCALLEHELYHLAQATDQYPQLWLDSREVVDGTKINYQGALNLYWMPSLALVRIDLTTTTTTLLRRTMAGIKWASPGVKRNAIVKLSTILNSAVSEELIPKNPAAILELPKRHKKEIDPFTLEEANAIIEKMYQTEHWPSTIYAAFFEFVFFTGMRLSEALALRWDAVDEAKERPGCVAASHWGRLWSARRRAPSEPFSSTSEHYAR